MKQVILNLAVTLDGFIAGPNGEIDWCIMDEDMAFDRFLDKVDSIFYGRISYDAWGNYQPEPEASAADKAFWDAIHAKKKYVFSRNFKSDPAATFISDAIGEQVAAIKKSGAGAIWLYGGASLIHSFLRLGLIDEYQLYVHPVVLGSGKPLFKDPEQPLSLNLVSSRQFRSGVVEMIYRPATKS
ncbi:dihydrofolate reductase family protein [Niabella terrae]